MTYKVGFRDTPAFWIMSAGAAIATREYRGFLTVVRRLGTQAVDDQVQQWKTEEEA